MSLFRRSAPEWRTWTPEPVVPPFPGADYVGGVGGAPSIDSALQVSTVWACVRLLSDTVSMMPLQAFTMQGDIRQPVPLPSLFVKPCDDATTTEWVYMLMTSLLLRGNAYGRVVQRDSVLYPSQIEPLNPDSVTIRNGKAGAPAYFVGTTEVPTQDILHLKAYRQPGYRLGMSPIQYAARAIQTEHAVQSFAHDFFKDGAHPSSIIYSDEDYSQEQSRTMKDRFMAAVNGREPALLSGGLKYQPIQVNPEESQFLATRKYAVPEIARIFGVPPEMVAGEAGNSMSYSNREQRSLDYLTYSVQAWLTRLEASFAELMPGKRHVRFDTSVLLRTDLETMMKATTIGIASKQTTPDEARAMRGLPPLTAAQKAVLDLVPLTVGPNGTPKPLPPASAAPAVDPAQEGAPA